MAISLALLLALLITLAAGLWWFRRRHMNQTSQPSAKPSNYHGVMIVAGPHACSAVRKISGRRLLAREAPLLPLTSCDSGHCQCMYHHLKDRRQPSERRHINVDIGEHHKQDEKRHGSDRRHHSLR